MLPHQSNPAGIAAAVLAGGRSRRMGQDKALAPLGGRPLIQHGLDVLSTIFPTILIIGREPGWWKGPGMICIPDDEPGRGPLGGLATALRRAEGRAVFLVGCDMPYLRRPAIELVLEHLPGAEAVVPVVGGILQSLHAAYTSHCLEAVEQQLACGDLSMRSLVAILHARLIDEQAIRRVDPELLSIRSLNRPEDLDGSQGSGQDAGADNG